MYEEEKGDRRVHTDTIYEQNKEAQHYLGDEYQVRKQ